VESKRLDSEGWGNAGVSDTIPHSWWAPLVAEIPRGSLVLELGAGAGLTAINLAMADMDYKFALLDFNRELLKQARAKFVELAHITKIPPPQVDFYLADTLALEEYPKSDVAISSGLLEHFQHDEIVKMLRLSAESSNRVISLVPNAKCKAYTGWKAALEQAGTWPYGYEQPYETMEPFFKEAGLRVLREYSIGLTFPVDETGEKYLLVTVGEK
jgi:SAM-dependent methyltransferase